MIVTNGLGCSICDKSGMGSISILQASTNLGNAQTDLANYQTAGGDDPATLNSLYAAISAAQAVINQIYANPPADKAASVASLLQAIGASTPVPAALPVSNPVVVPTLVPTVLVPANNPIVAAISNSNQLVQATSQPSNIQPSVVPSVVSTPIVATPISTPISIVPSGVISNNDAAPTGDSTVAVSDDMFLGTFDLTSFLAQQVFGVIPMWGLLLAGSIGVLALIGKEK